MCTFDKHSFIHLTLVSTPLKITYLSHMFLVFDLSPYPQRLYTYTEK